MKRSLLLVFAAVAFCCTDPKDKCYECTMSTDNKNDPKITDVYCGYATTRQAEENTGPTVINGIGYTKNKCKRKR